MSKARDLANAGTALTTVSATELGYLDGVTSAVQTQIDSKIGQSTAINPTIVDAKGDIIAATAADTVARLAVGANDTVLTADSTTATGLKWATPTSGGMTLISTTTLTGASVTISSIPQTYNYLYLIIRNFLPASDGANLSMRFNGDSAANRHVENTGTGAPGAVLIGSTSVRAAASADNAVTQNLSIITIPDYTNTVTWKHADIYAVTVDATTNTSYRPLWIKADYNQTTAISSLNFFCNTGNITSGTAYLYGVK